MGKAASSSAPCRLPQDRSCRALSPGQEDSLRFSKQLGGLTMWCSGKPDIVGCARWTGGSRELARKHWLGAQLRRQALGPELYSSAIRESPPVAATFRQTLQSIQPSRRGWGWGILAALQPSLPINLMSCRGHIMESFR